MKFKKHSERKIYHIFLFPIIYFCFIGLIIFDIFLEIYHRTSFPIYKYKYIDRSRYIKIDRHRLPYLSTLEKINCAYCGYANGLIRYSQIILALTEDYWCGIKHEVDDELEQHHHKNFIKYNDKEAYIKL